MAKKDIARDKLRSIIVKLSSDDLGKEEHRETIKNATAIGFDKRALFLAVKFYKMDRDDAKELWAMLDSYMTYSGILD